MGFLVESGSKNAVGKVTEKHVFEHDSLGHLIRSIEYAYTHDGNTATCTLVQHTEHNYDTDNRLTEQSWTVGNTTYSEGYAYGEANGTLTQMTTATGDTLNYAYDGLQRLQSTTLKNAAGTSLLTHSVTYGAVSGYRSSSQVELYRTRRCNDNMVLAGQKYVYDTLGNISEVYDSEPYPGGTLCRLLVSYTYDSQNQLLSETYHNYAPGDVLEASSTTTYAYAYDAAGNILTVRKNGAIAKSFWYDSSTWADKVTAVNQQNIIYDDSGNPTTYSQGYTDPRGNPGLYYMTWEEGNRLTYLSYEEPQYRFQVSYAYDADGIRSMKYADDGEHTYITQNGRVVRETIGSGSTAKILDFIYDASGKPFALKYKNGSSATVTYHYITNLKGDVVGLIDQTGEYIAQYAYDAWGNHLSVDGSMASINPLRYRGYYYDTETGFYYLQSRYYDPANYRFINADECASTGQGILGTNMFAYCENSPVVFIDSCGREKTYVLYYDRENSGFYTQSHNSRYYNNNNVEFIAFTTVQEFTDAWNSMDGEIDEVYIYAHGGEGVLYFSDGKLAVDGNRTFDSFNDVSVNDTVYLFSCSGGSGKEGSNVAWILADKTDTDVRACTGSVSFSKDWFTGEYYARKAFDWGIWKYFYYGKKYVIFGNSVARSSILFPI